MTSAEEQASFYYELGVAFSQWAQVEHALGSLIVACVQEPDRKAVFAGFYAIENFRSKLAYADAIFKARHKSGAMFDRWTTLSARLSRNASTRNRLAHRAVVTFSVDHNPQGRRIALVDWMTLQNEIWESKLTNKPPAGSLCVRDIVIARLEYFAANVATRNFAFAVAGQPEPFPKCAEQPQRPPTNRELTNQILEALALPPKPSRKK